MPTEINILLEQRGKYIYIKLNNIHNLSLALGLPPNGQLLKALSILRRYGNGKLRSPDTLLFSVLPYPFEEINLTKLHFHINAPYFEWSYARYKKASTPKLELVKLFDRMLTELGVFDY